MSLSGPESSFIKACVGSSDGSALNQLELDLYESLVQTLFRLLKNVQLHSMDNQAVQQTLKQMVELVEKGTRLEESEVRLSFVGDAVFVCGRLLYASSSIYESADQLAETLKGAGVHEIVFRQGLTIEDLDSFCRAFIIAVVKGREGFLLRTQYSNIDALGVQGEAETNEGEAPSSGSGPALEVLFHMVHDLQSVVDAGAVEVTLPPSSLKRYAQTMIGLVQQEPALVKAFLASRAIDSREGHEVTQSLAFSLLLASSFSSSRSDLSQLGQACLLAGLTKAIHKRLQLNDAAPILVALGLRFGGVSEDSAERMILAFNALEEDEGRGSGKSLQGDIIWMALVYTACINGASENEGGNPLGALAKLASVPNSDTLLLRVAVEVLGLVPPGTILELDGKSWCVVLPQEKKGNLARPIVRLFADSRGNLVKDKKDLDLSVGAGAGMKVTSIVTPLNFEFQTASVLLADSSG